jgi:hypothetical protein
MSGETGGTLLEAAAKAEIVIEERQGLSEAGATNLVPPIIKQSPPGSDLSDGRHEVPPLDSVWGYGFDRCDLDLPPVPPNSNLAGDGDRIPSLEPQNLVAQGRPEWRGLNSPPSVSQGEQGVGRGSGPDLDFLYQKDIRELGAGRERVQRQDGTGQVETLGGWVTIRESGVISIGSARLPYSQRFG